MNTNPLLLTTNLGTLNFNIMLLINRVAISTILISLLVRIYLVILENLSITIRIESYACLIQTDSGNPTMKSSEMSY
jgi:hypothetical protein